MIPDKFLCGQNKYNGKLQELAFLTYQKLDGTIASEKSFNNWLGAARVNQNREVIKTWFDNVPTAGIKIMHTVGGGGGGWNTRQAYVRIKDPRGFEVEITDENFLDICKESGVTNGVLDGEFVYWFGDASRIYLTRFGSAHCTNAMDETKKMIETQKIKESLPKFSFRDIKLGHKYTVNIYGKHSLTAIYVGKLKCYDSYNKESKNEHVFLVLNYQSHGWEPTTNSFEILRNNNIVCDSGECWSEDECHKLTQTMGEVDRNWINNSIMKNRCNTNNRTEEDVKWVVDNYINKKFEV